MMIAESAATPDMSESTHSWLTFLQEQGIDLDAPAQALPAGSFVSPLTHLGLIQVSGDDAASFLHAQLSNDVEHLPQNQARLAAYCTAKGRMLASLLMWRRGDQIYLQLPREILPAIQKRLQMYVLRSKVKLLDVSDELVAIGLAGANTTTLGQAEPPANIWDTVAVGDGVLIRMPDTKGVQRYQWVATAAAAREALPALSASAPLLAPSNWRLADIEAGLPSITKATQEQFVPQMVNFELLGGVNFKKGCYPGQEIVARSQYLGKLKRRMYLVEVAGDAAAGNEVFAESDPSQPGGMLVNVEASASGKSLALAELKSSLLDEAGSLHAGAADGPLLTLQKLPYALPDPA